MNKRSVNIKRQFGIREVRTNMGIFDFDVICVIGDFKKTLKYVAWKFEDEKIYEYENEEASKGFLPLGRCWQKRGYVPVIWIPSKPRTAREFATLGHEALHAVFKLIDWAGIEANRHTEEVVAHAQAHIVSQVLEKLGLVYRK